jgi:DNA-directed RNA polymerase subunit beta'
LEAKDFKSLRISLASPQDILNWSYGEVLKPETINYRRLRPEKDGLFCEAIFGPSRDWQCYCGKYKNIRYKGITCDKCGVEVTRASVRRERMGHITLAAPVAHVWYTRRVPSYMGIILDVSRRNLDRVLYFAQYVVTHVDEDARQRALKRLDDEQDPKLSRERSEISARLGAAREYLQSRTALIQERIAKVNEQYEGALQNRLQPLLDDAQHIQQILENQMGQTTSGDIGLRTTDIVIVDAGEEITRKHLNALNTAVQRELNAVESDMQDQRDRLIADLQMEGEKYRAEAELEIAKQESLAEEANSKLNDRIAQERDELQSLHVLMFLPEGRYRELKTRYGQVFRAAMGAEAFHEILSAMDLDKLAKELWHEIRSTKSNQRRKKAIKRLKVIESLRRSNNRPEWLILTVLPVIPPDLRPMVQLDGGRFATSDLNDLYRRVINRNNRLKRLMELGAPDVIVRNEKRMLQEAVDSLVDNSQRGKMLSRRGRRELKSLSDMLKGKKGRFRRNLLGKRVDYSGRSVIVVGPKLKLHQCGLPKTMALELYRPFVIAKLVEYNYASNVKGAKRFIERNRPEVWEVLEEVIKDRPVLLNRAPTLHRLGIQAFEPMLVEGKAIHLHPLVCSAFNADFDGDQMAVHVPLSRKAVQEAYDRMLASKNLLKPADGSPIVGPSKDMVLGVYYMNLKVAGRKGEGRVFGSLDEVKLAYDLEQVHIHACIKLRITTWFKDGTLERLETPETKIVETSVGRALFNQILPPEMHYVNMSLAKNDVQAVVAASYQAIGSERTVEVVDQIKNIGFTYATRSGTTIAVSDITVPEVKADILARSEERVAKVEQQFRRGLLTEQEMNDRTIEIWTAAKEELEKEVKKVMNPLGDLSLMATSGATKGGFSSVSQLAGMRGLMADPSGRIIPLPIRSNFREGLRALEYFLSTHGSRKGLADTALRTADAGYLTRRLVDVAQDQIINNIDCGTEAGRWVRRKDDIAGQKLASRIMGRMAASPIINPKTGEVIVGRNEEITDLLAEEIDALGVTEVFVRSPLTCETRLGICARCYGRDLGWGGLGGIGTAVGIIAAQSIGEPGTQLTLRTFHSGGVATGGDITTGLPRVEEIFEARKQPKGEAVITDLDGTVEIDRRENDQRVVRVKSSQLLSDEYMIPTGWEIAVRDASEVADGTVLAQDGTTTITASHGGKIAIEGEKIFVSRETREEQEYDIPSSSRILVSEGQKVAAGDLLTEGSQNPHRILHILGREACELYLLAEVQKVYRSQGQNINDKHFEVIIRKMMCKMQVMRPGETGWLPGELVDRFEFQDKNEYLVAHGRTPATAAPTLLGITKASLATESFLSAASFQHTIRVLAGAAIEGKVDKLAGLKENVIIGKLIPAGTGYGVTSKLVLEPVEEPDPAVVAEIGETYNDFEPLTTGDLLPEDEDLDEDDLLGEEEDDFSEAA